MADLRITTVLAAPADRVWCAAQQPATLAHVARGLLTFPDLEGRQDPWREGETVTTRMRLFGLVPLWWHRLTVERVDHEARELRSDESGGLVRSWRHRIAVEALTGITARYTDELWIDAGPLTGPVQAFAWLLYHHRQRRWRAWARLPWPVGTAQPAAGA